LESQMGKRKIESTQKDLTREKSKKGKKRDRGDKRREEGTKKKKSGWGRLTAVEGS